MKIETKILGGFLMLSLLVGTIGYFNFSNIKRIDSSFTLLDNYHKPASDSLGAMKTETLNVFSSTLKFEFAESESNQTAEMKEKSIQEITRIAEGKARFDSILGKYRYITDEYAPTNEKIIAGAIEKKWAAFSEASERLLILRKGRAENREILEAKRELEDAENALMDTLNDAASYEESIIGDNRDSSKALVRNTLISTVLVLTITIIAALGSGILISASITDPVNRLKDAAEGVSRGNLDTKIKVDSGDEIEDLANSFNRMVQNIRYSKELTEDRERDIEESRNRLEKDIKELKKTGKLTEREMRVIELKKRINDLREELLNYEK